MLMTASHIGNTGINRVDEESDRSYVNGFLARSFTEPSNWRSERTLSDLLTREGIPALAELDTRSVTRHIRSFGSMRGGIFPTEISTDEAIDQVRSHPSMEGLDGASTVSCQQPYDWRYGSEARWICSTPISSSQRFRVAVLDCGVKKNILRRLVDVGCEVRVFPLTSSAEDIASYEPRGLLISNGPGDPAAVQGAVDIIRTFLGKLPVFGICLGHQLLALAARGRTYKMKFGHRGINHPVGENAMGRIIVSVHNHGFAVSPDPLPDGGRITLRSLNDDTIEGLEYPELNAFSVQFHPEASPGPHDASDMFLEFSNRMRKHAGA